MRPASRATTFGVLLTALVTFVDQDSVPRLMTLRQGLSQAGDVRGSGSVSADGRMVAFASTERLVPADSNDVMDIYVFDRLHATLTLETTAWGSGSSDGGSGSPSLDADGRFLVFDSDATNLTSETDRNRARDVFVRDRREGSTRRISVGASGQEANSTSLYPTISADGRLAAFASHATNLVAGVDANSVGADAYLARLDTGEVSRGSVGSDGRQSSTGQSTAPALSADGHLITFTSSAAIGPEGARASQALVPAVWIRDLTSGVTTCLSCRNPGRAFDPHLSGEGRVVVFTLQQISRGPEIRRTDIVLFDRTTLVTSVITRKANGSSGRPSVSADGRFIVFQSQASNLECARRCGPDVTDENLLSDVYLFDRETGTFTRLSGDPRSWWAPSLEPSVDARGRVVVFSSRQPLSVEDTTTAFDLFIWTREGSPLSLSVSPGLRTGMGSRLLTEH
jgi:Tol biopolymer transport system component